MVKLTIDLLFINLISFYFFGSEELRFFCMGVGWINSIHQLPLTLGKPISLGPMSQKVNEM